MILRLLSSVIGFCLAATGADSNDFAHLFYRTGAAPAPVTATMEGSSRPFPAATVPCAGCHGKDGRGSTEGSIASADIRWSALAGRHNEDSFCRALTEGVNPAGEPLARAMPRYRLERSQCDALRSYLQSLETDLAPGVSNDSLSLGMVLDDDRESHRAWIARFEQELAKRSSGAGVYGRKIEIHTDISRPAALWIALGSARVLPRLSAMGSPVILLQDDAPPPPSELDVFYVETATSRQIETLLSLGGRWLGIKGSSPWANHAWEAFADLSGQEWDGSCDSLKNAAGLIAFGAGSANRTPLDQISRCADKTPSFFMRPELPVEQLAASSRPAFLLLPFNPGASLDATTTASLAAAAVLDALDAGGRRLRVPSLVNALDQRWRQSGRKQHLLDGVAVLPLNGSGAIQWIPGP